MTPRELWREDAVCAQVGPELYFLEGKGTSPREALQVCAGCARRDPSYIAATHCATCGQPFSEDNPKTAGHTLAIRNGGTASDGHQINRCPVGHAPSRKIDYHPVWPASGARASRWPARRADARRRMLGFGHRRTPTRCECASPA